MNGPLEGVRVVELGFWVAGPAAAGVMADWGAEVIKIEPPTGDPMRGLFSTAAGIDVPINPPFELDNRGKRSIVLDLTDADGRAVAERLVARADVLVTNVRLGALERLALDPETLTARYRTLVYAAITGYGMEGPERDRAAYDISAFWARSGLAHLLTFPGGEPPFQRGGMGDHGVGMAAAAGVAAALLARERSGRGQVVSASLFRHGAYTIGFDLNTALRLGMSIGVGSREVMANPAINSYRDSAGAWFWLVGLEGDRHWPDLARAVGRSDWLTDSRFATASARRRNSRELISRLDEIFATRTIAEWSSVFDAEGVWWAPVQTVDQVLADPQLRAAGGFVEVPDGATTATMIATPVDFSGTPWTVKSMPPALGEHTDEILGELGLDGAAIAALRATGAVA